MELLGPTDDATLGPVPAQMLGHVFGPLVSSILRPGPPTHLRLFTAPRTPRSICMRTWSFLFYFHVSSRARPHLDEATSLVGTDRQPGPPPTRQRLSPSLGSEGRVALPRANPCLGLSDPVDERHSIIARVPDHRMDSDCLARPGAVAPSFPPGGPLRPDTTLPGFAPFSRLSSRLGCGPGLSRTLFVSRNFSTPRWPEAFLWPLLRGRATRQTTMVETQERILLFTTLEHSHLALKRSRDTIQNAPSRSPVCCMFSSCSYVACPTTCCHSRCGKEAQDWTTKQAPETTSSDTRLADSSLHQCALG